MTAAVVLGNGCAPKRIAAAAMRYVKGPIKGMSIPLQASGRAQRAGTLAKTTRPLNPPALPRSGAPDRTAVITLSVESQTNVCATARAVLARLTPHPIV